MSSAVMINNFVSVSAVSDKDQLERIHRISLEEELVVPVAIGWQVSNKSINRGTQNPRQPNLAELGELDRATRDYGLVSAIHYYTKDNQTIVDDLERVVDLGVDPSSALLQFNTLPPTPEILKSVKEMGYRIIFKVAVSDKGSPGGGYAVWRGEAVQDVKSGEIDPLIQQVYERRDFINYVMFDPSHGTNLELDLDETNLAVRFGKTITSMCILNDMGLIYAGGINPTNVGGLARVLTSTFPGRISIDVESGVRTDNELDLQKVREYFRNCKDSF